MNEREFMKEAYGDRMGCGGPLYLACVILAVMMLFGCKSVQYVPVVETHTDSVYITKQQRDSIWLHDSVYVREYAKGDTVYMELTKWHTKYVEKLMTDTLYQHKIDSIPKPYPVPAKLTTWQKAKQDFGGYAIVFALIIFIVLVYIFILRLQRRFFLRL